MAPKTFKRRKTKGLKIVDDKDKHLYKKDKVAARQKAHELYLQGCWYNSEIAEALAIPEDTLFYWTNTKKNNWKQERQKLDDIAAKQALKSKRDRMLSILGDTLVTLEENLKIVKKKEMSVNSLEKLTNMSEKLHRMLRLEDGEATSIEGKVDMTKKGIKKVIEELKDIDPYVDYEMIETKEELLN